VSAFNHLPQLHLHQLTRGDIIRYVQDTIGRHPYLLKLKHKHPPEVDQIINDMIDKSSGVFLWVVLACRSLLSGFTDCDRISELRSLVDELPGELQQMFEKMLSRIKGRHRVQGAKLFRMVYKCEAARRRPEPTTKSYPLISALGLARLDDNLVHLAEISPKSKIEACLEIEGRL